MAKKQVSREHHWWPVGLQKHWTDRTGNISWVNPEGIVTKKKAENRKVAKKAHGHTVLLNGPWTTNFEDDFDSADNSIHRVLANLDLMPARGGANFGEFISLLGLLRKCSISADWQDGWGVETGVRYLRERAPWM